MNPIVRRYVKHATLVEACFPPSGTQPNSNELSYLVYYAQSKPAKLTKVGAYLGKRLARDVQKARHAEVLVALGVFDALLEASARDLHFFARDVLDCLDQALGAADLALAKAATKTFTLFCRAHSGTTLGIDTELRARYTRLLAVYASYARVGKEQAPGALWKPALGLCAIQAVAESPATYAVESYYELPRIVRAVVARIAASGMQQPVASGQPAPTMDEMLASITDHTTDKAEFLGSWAWRCLNTLVQRSHGQHSRVIVSEIFGFLDTRLQWQPTSLCVSIVAAAIGRLQTQDQNMVVIETLAFLTTEDPAGSQQLYLDAAKVRENSVLSVIDIQADAAGGKAADRRACVIRILERMFCQPYVLVGISVMEALNVLVTFLLESVTTRSSHAIMHPDYAMLVNAFEEATGSASKESLIDSAESVQAKQLADYYHLLAAIGGLATHQYYTSQLSDMAGYLISRMRLAETGESEALLASREWLLQALHMVLRCTSKADAAKHTLQQQQQQQQQSLQKHVLQQQQQQPSALPLATFSPLFALVSTDNWELHAQAVDCIVEILRHNARSEAPPSWPDTCAPGLVDAIYQKLVQYLQHIHGQAGARSAEYAAVAVMLREIAALQGSSAIQDVVWVLDRGAPAAQQENNGWLTVLAMVWTRVARLDPNVSLGRHVESAIQDAQAVRCWDSAIEEACLQDVPIMSMQQTSKVIVENDSACSSDTVEDASLIVRMREVARRLSVKVALENLGPVVLAKYADTRAERARTASNESPEAVDHVLVGAAEPNDTAFAYPVTDVQLPSASDQVNDIRARVSMDWEKNDAHHKASVSTPTVNLDQLRAALRDGLAMRSSDHVDVPRSAALPRSRMGLPNGMSSSLRKGRMSVVSGAGGGVKQMRSVSDAYSTSISSSANLDSDLEGREEEEGEAEEEEEEEVPVETTESAGSLPMGVDAPGTGMVDALGRPVSDEIRDLLDSIDDGQPPCFPPAIAQAPSSKSLSGVYGHLDDTRGSSSAVSTPVISHVI
ncbi:plasma membrane localization protein [Coemansia sp. Benny D115]|nr:plasma membrane localization protein [Coemansia sp. Benny D115]